MFTMFVTVAANAQVFKKTKGNDKYVTREYKLNDFSKVNITHAFNVIYKINPDSAGFVRVYGEENILDIMSVKSEKGMLSVQLSGLRDPEFGVILIHMYSSKLESVNNEGSGTFEIQTPIEATEIKLSILGSGQLKTEEITCGSLSATVGGSGDLLIKGKTGFASMNVQGSGEIRALDLKVETMDAVITGSGVIRCEVEKELKAVITGSGRIYYNGKPELKTRMVGSGQIIPL